VASKLRDVFQSGTVFGVVEMILKELMKSTGEVFSLTTDARLSQVADMMREKRIGAVVIVDETDVVIGLITDRDIALALALGAGTPDSFVNEVMSADVLAIHESTSLFDLTQKFRENAVKCFAVVDDNGSLVGVVSSDDVMALLSREMYDTCISLESKLGHLI
jgi:CBS domain-containing protein